MYPIPNIRSIQSHQTLLESQTQATLMWSIPLNSVVWQGEMPQAILFRQPHSCPWMAMGKAIAQCKIFFVLTSSIPNSNSYRFPGVRCCDERLCRPECCSSGELPASRNRPWWTDSVDGHFVGSKCCVQLCGIVGQPIKIHSLNESFSSRTKI